jgi:hypothetical protein
MRILFAIPGLHLYNRGAEIAFTSIANELATMGESVTLIGSGLPHEGAQYRFLHAGSIARENFEFYPSVPALRNQFAYEDLTFIPNLLFRYKPQEYDVTLTCSFPFTNIALRRPTFCGAIAACPSIGCSDGSIQRSSHTVWDCKYHLVWTTKYRYPVLGGTLVLVVGELLRETARAHEMVVHAGSIIAAATPRMAQSRIERSFILRTRQGLLANSLCSRLPPLDVAKRQSDFSDDQGND